MSMNLIKTFWNNSGYNLVSMNMEEEYMTVEKLQEVFGEWPLRVGKFEKVSYEQFKKDWLNTYNESGDEELRTEEAIRDAYDTLNVPTRGSTGSDGYDFYSPLSFTLYPNEYIKIPTGIKIYMLEGFSLTCVPRSSVGNKYHCRISGTVALIDNDYYNNTKNEGHIMIAIRNEGDKPFSINKGERFCQGSIRMGGITFDDNVNEIRNGGFGSTGK